MELEPLRAGMEQAIPFNGHLGLEIVEVSVGRGVARLPDDQTLRNHTGSQHASALFAVGEAASGAALAAVFVEHLPQLELSPESAEISYKRSRAGRSPPPASWDQTPRRCSPTSIATAMSRSPSMSR